ncbi:hypothetical protein F511_31855 [Dorcoceras hygrometricum]|uniref:Uncharacterized protein n=1 Tax=Dorcoceras hygrometricum TaxID=472368 RepID=A0A2Z7AMY3_9LAMI|nr:hypothetical protein F511_31855 [Dorcoceras hygrometricum]
MVFQIMVFTLAAALPPLYKPPPPPPPVFVGKFFSGQLDEENPFVLISSVLLVQADEGVSFLVVDRIGEYRNLPRRADVIVTTVGARHKCQQALAAALPPLYKPPPPPVFAGKIVSGQLDEENPFVLISSVLLVQADEGVSFLVMDRIGDFYRNLPRRADVIVTTVGARHKCQQAGGRIRIPNSKSGSARLLLARRFFLYHFRRLGLILKKIAKGATLCSLLAFWPIGYFVQLTLWAYQISYLSDRDLDCGNCSSEVKSTRSVLGKCVYLVTLAMSLFDLQDVCIAIGSIATLDLPMVVDLIGIYGLKGPYCTLTTTNRFLQALSVIPRGSWGDVARRSYHDPLGRFPHGYSAQCVEHEKRICVVRLPESQQGSNRALAAALPPLYKPPPPPVFAGKIVSGQLDEENPFVLISSVLLVQADEGVSFLVMDRIGDFYRNLPRRADVIVTTVGARHKCQQAGGRIRIPNSKSGSARLLLARRFFLYHFRRLGLILKKIAKGATLCSLLAFWPIGYFVQLTLWAYQISYLSDRDLDCGVYLSTVAIQQLRFSRGDFSSWSFREFSADDMRSAVERFE